MNLMSSTLLTEDTGVPFHQLQAEQIQMFRDAWTAAGHEREPRVSVSRSIFPLVSDLDRAYFGHDTQRARTRSATSTAGWRGSASRTPASPTSWSKELGRGRGRRRCGHAAAHGPQPARASTTTRTCSRASCATSRRSSAGAEPTRLSAATRHRGALVAVTGALRADPVVVALNWGFAAHTTHPPRCHARYTSIATED